MRNHAALFFSSEGVSTGRWKNTNDSFVCLHFRCVVFNNRGVSGETLLVRISVQRLVFLCVQKKGRALRHDKFSLFSPRTCVLFVALGLAHCVRPTRVPEPTLGSLSRHDDVVVARRGLSCRQILYFNAEARKYDPGEHVLF